MGTYFELIASNSMGTQTINSFATKAEAEIVKRAIEKFYDTDDLEIFDNDFTLFIEQHSVI